MVQLIAPQFQELLRLFVMPDRKKMSESLLEGIAIST